jgi:hypothetical protein
MPAAIALSAIQLIIMPPLHFSISIVQRGIIIMFIAGPAGIVVMPIMGRSIVIIVLVSILRFRRWFPSRREPRRP